MPHYCRICGRGRRKEPPYSLNRIERTQELVVPVLFIYEPFKKVLRERGEQPAL
jgi:hypothetical protein